MQVVMSPRKASSWVTWVQSHSPFLPHFIELVVQNSIWDMLLLNFIPHQPWKVAMAVPILEIMAQAQGISPFHCCIPSPLTDTNAQETLDT